VNGRDVPVDAEGGRSLLSVLRDDLNLTGSKYGCGEGRCGACTVLLDGAPTRSCQVAVGSVGHRKILTIESLEHDGQLHPLQQAFLNHDAFQCGLPGQKPIALPHPNPLLKGEGFCNRQI